MPRLLFRLRRPAGNRGHVDLLRGQHYRKRAQFFALYDDVRALPPNTAWTKLREMHDWFLSQIQENSDLVSRCKTGAEVDAAAAQHRTAALLSVEGATCWTVPWITWKPWPPGASD